MLRIQVEGRCGWERHDSETDRLQISSSEREPTGLWVWVEKEITPLNKFLKGKSERI